MDGGISDCRIELLSDRAKTARNRGKARHRVRGDVEWLILLVSLKRERALKGGEALKVTL